MKKYIFCLLMLFPFMFCGCNNYLEGHEIVGTWVHNEKTIVFTENGRATLENAEYDYFLSDKNVIIDENGEAVILPYNINSNGSLLLGDEIFYPQS